jgi:hypothetical protein
VGTTIGRDHVVDLVVGNRHPFAVDFDFVVVANHATLGRATIHQVATRALAIISFELRVEALMPFIVAYPVISFLRRRAYTKKHGERASKRHPFHPSGRAGHVCAKSIIGEGGRLCPGGNRRTRGKILAVAR